MDTKKTLESFDKYLASRGLSLQAVAIGGSAMNLLGFVSRPTEDCDILYPALPPAIRTAAQDFAAQLRSTGESLKDDWLNDGPASLAADLPAGWQDRLQPLFSGQALALRCLGRSDLLLTKLFALCDRGLDLADCIALAPTPKELDHSLRWLEQRDAHPDWPTHVRETLADLRGRLHGI